MSEISSNSAKRAAMALIAVLAWFALLLQLVLMVHGSTGSSILRTLVNYFSFFTILTNLLVALGLTLPLVLPESSFGRFFSRPSVQAGIAVYIAVVGLTYSLLLRQLWNPAGLQKLADVLLHDGVPILYVGYWLIFVPKSELRWKHAVLWLAYPVAYMVYTLIHGVFSAWYPYYFIDVGVLGYPRAFANAAGVLAAFFGLGLLAVALGRWMGRRSAGSGQPAPSSTRISGK